MNRRSWVLAGAGVAAAVVGAASRLGRGGPLPNAEAAASKAATDPSNTFLWNASFALPEGGTLVMASLRGQPLVLNFWATWCPPCVKEMPEIDRFAGPFQARGGKVLGLAVDNPTAVKTFLGRTPVHYLIGLAGADGTEFSRKLGNDGGALPFTAVIDRRGQVVQRRLGTSSFDELAVWTKGL